MRAHHRPAVPMRIAIDFALAPVRAVIAQVIEHGTVDVVDQDGRELAVFQRDGRLFATAPAIEGLADWFDAAVGDDSLTEPLRRLTAALDERAEFSESMLADLQALLPRLKQAGRRVPPEVARAIVDRQRAVMAQEAA